MKVVSRVLAAFLIAALVLPALATPVSAAIQLTDLGLSDSSGPVGTEVYLWGESNGDRGFVYYELDPDGDVWERVLRNVSGDWVRMERYGDGTAEDPYFWVFETATFEIPESIGGDHRIAVVRSDRGATTTYSDLLAHRASVTNWHRTFKVEPTMTVLAVDGRSISAPGDAAGPAGTEVEVEGKGFGDEEDITIYVDGVEADLVEPITTDYLGTWTGSFIVPAVSQGTHDITASGDDTRERDVTGAPFKVTPGISITPKEGAVGSEFTVSGTGFRQNESGIEILFGDKAVKTGVSANEDGAFQTTVTVPAATMGEHEIGAKGSNTREADVQKRTFEVEPSFTFEPLEGHVGTEIEVAAKGLPADTTVTVTYAGDAKGTGTTDNNGTLAPITFAATHPQSTHTPEQTVTVTFNDTTITRVFEMDSTPPPTPAPRAPEAGERIGLVGKQAPTLAWTVVEDPSGVTYSLQIATAADFSQVLISKSGLVAQSSNVTMSPAGTEMRYTLAETEELPYGTYYWRVKAIDGAMNESNWSASSSFKIGLLPTWALIVIAVLAVILIAALVYVLIIRDRVGLYD